MNREQNLFFDIEIMIEHDIDEYERFLLIEINLIMTSIFNYCNQLWNELLFRSMRESIKLSFLIKLLQSLIYREIRQFNPLDNDRSNRRCCRPLRRNCYI